MTLVTLRPEQQRVIDEYRGGYAAISAVPGAGKTTTLSALAADLIARGALRPHQRVVVVTYQNAAVANVQAAIRQRLEALGLPPDRGYIVRTLHGLANDVLRAGRHRVQLDVEARVAADLETTAILAEARQRQQARWGPRMISRLSGEQEIAHRLWHDDYLIGKILEETLRDLRLHHVDYPSLQSKIDGRYRWAPFVLAVAGDYDGRLREEGWIDYDGLVRSAVEALEGNALLAAQLRERWPFLLEDEAQDSTPLLERMLTLIAGPDGNLVRVGDANQAILTSFTLSDVHGFRRWVRNQAQQHFELRGSSRSTPAIVSLANRFLHWARDDFPVPEIGPAALEPRAITTIPGENPPNPERTLGLTVREFEVNDQERQEVVKRAIGHMKRNPNDRVAILVGRQATGYLYAQEAVARDFPDNKIIRMLGAKDGRAIPVVERLLPLIEFLQEPRNLFQLVGLLRLWTDPAADRVVLALEEISRSGHDHPLEALLYGGLLNETELPDDLSDDEVATLRRLRAIPRWLDERLAPPHELLGLIAATIEAEDTDRRIMNGIVSALSSANLNRERDHLSDLHQFLNDFRRQVRDLRGTPEQHLIDIAPGTITVSTRHQAKGLEWDVVFAVECDNFWFPGDLEIERPTHRAYAGPHDPVVVARAEIASLLNGAEGVPEPGDLDDWTERTARERVEESLRLMYVTITRAKRALWISWHRKGGESGTWERRESEVVTQIARLIEEVEHEFAG